MSTQKNTVYNAPQNQKVGPDNNRTALIFVATVVVLMVALLGLYLAINF